MNSKRWIALGLAAALLFISIGFQFAMSVASGFFDALLEALDDSHIEENVMVDGKLHQRIAVINLDGIIQGTEALWGVGYDHQRFLKMIKKAGEDSTVEAVVLRVNTPGGAVVETEQIYNALLELQHDYDTPFYVSMGNTAASGGYYIAAPANKIFAEPATLTGSIGVIMESLNFAGLAEKHGVTFNVIKSGKHKDILSPSREMTQEEEAILQEMIDDMYDDFVQVIVEGRNLDEKTVRELGDGRIYTGKQAKEVDLVDEVGDFKATLAAIQEDYELEGAQVVQYNLPFGTVQSFGMQLKERFLGEQSDIATILNLLQYSDKPRAMYIY